ncbi:MAG: hypothetical protein JWO36_5908 [Myxococcales bacterium]|nr:hypothetical protein [Myxococcales bacterium]
MPETLSTRQIVELFHMIFVRALFSGLPDKRLIAIKGGINLRFFFHSVRFSEDLDLDVTTMAKATLENRIDRLLQSPALISPLKSRGVSIREVSKPKQTETVQRWKLAIATGSVEERTNIEFSRRDAVDRAKSEPIAALIANAYDLPTFIATHYTCADAILQKIQALAGRDETQPRDVFDLHVLFARRDAPKKLDDDKSKLIAAAAKNAADLSYERYLALVVAYLDPDHADVYSSRDAWEAMQLEVIGRIEALA